MTQLQKLVLKLFIIAVLAIIACATKAQSLASITGENVSVMDALAHALDRKPETYTVREFHKDVKEYSAHVGIPYYNATTNAYNNIAILHADSKGYFSIDTTQYIGGTANVVVGTNVSTNTNVVGVNNAATQGNVAGSETNNSSEIYEPYSQSVDTTGMSPFQIEWHISRGHLLRGADQVSTESIISQWSTPLSGETIITTVGATNSCPGCLLPMVTDYDTKLSINAPALSIETPSLVPDQDQEACLLCEDGHNAQTVQQQWAAYMALGRALKRDGLSTKVRKHLVDCRIQLGKECRPYHGKLTSAAPRESKHDVSFTAASALPEFCGYQREVATKSKKANNGIAQARWKTFVRGWKLFWGRIGACSRK